MGRKRRTLVDTLGLLLNVVVHPADVQDATAPSARGLAYWGVEIGYIVRRTDVAGFAVLSKRWIVERTFA
jgi:hypothetical protein